MDRYAYLLLGLSLLLPLTGVLLQRKDLASKAIKFGVLGGVAGLVSEVFYFRDYWQPPSLMGVATVSIEDFIFGFAITALSFTLYPCLFKAKFTTRQASQIRRYLLFFIIGFASMLVFNLYGHVNSIFVSSAVFMGLASTILFLRKDLLLMGLYSAAILTSFIVVVYIILFGFAAPHFWDNYWLLANTKWGVAIFGSVPLTEIIWYFSWILFASISYPFVSGKELSKQK
jgi:hypothetical protein